MRIVGFALFGVLWGFVAFKSPDPNFPGEIAFLGWVLCCVGWSILYDTDRLLRSRNQNSRDFIGYVMWNIESLFYRLGGHWWTIRCLRKKTLSNWRK